MYSFSNRYLLFLEAHILCPMFDLNLYIAQAQVLKLLFQEQPVTAIYIYSLIKLCEVTSKI